MDKLAPARIDVIKNKILAFEGWRLRALKCLEENREEDFELAIKWAYKCMDDLWYVAMTSKNKGRDWGWWD